MFDGAFSVYQDLRFGFAGTDGSADGILSGNYYDNRQRVYQLDGDPALSADEQALNDNILRVRRDPGVNINRRIALKRVPEITGRIDIPVSYSHNLGDLFVPFSMQQIYAKEVAERGRSHLMVSRTTRAVGHCEFSQEEIARDFDDLVLWVDEGIKPAGDDILDASTVADPLFGCQFTQGVSGLTPEFLRAGVCDVAP